MKLSRPTIGLAIASLIFCFVLVTDIVPWLRGPVPWLPGDSAWTWLNGVPRWAWVIPCAIGIAVYLLGVVSLLRSEIASTRLVILWAFVGSVLLTLLLMTMEGRPLYLLFARSASTVLGGYQVAGNMISDLGYTMRNWSAFVMNYRTKYPAGGIAIAPPGLAVLYYTADRLFAAIPAVANIGGSLLRPLQCQNLAMQTWTNDQWANAWPQMLMPLWAALAVAPLYRLGVLVFNRKIARTAVLLWPLIPGLALFSPRFNVFYALMQVVMLVFLYQGLLNQRWLPIVLAGFIVSIGMFLNFSLVPMGLLGGMIILLHWWRTARRQAGLLIKPLAAFGIGCAAFWVVYGALSGDSFFSILKLSFDQHLTINRPYFPWLFMHPYDMFLWIGLPLAALAIWRIVHVRHLNNAPDVFVAAAGLSLLILILSGTARGETGRVWLFFAPVWLLLAADVLQRFKLRDRVAILIMQGVCLFSMAAVLRPNFTELTPPAQPAPVSEAAAFPIDAHFVRGQDAVTLVGLSLDKTASQVTFHFHWRADNRYVTRPYVLSLLPVAPDGSYLPSQNWDPMNWNYPPSCWLPDQEFVDTVVVPLGKSPQIGNWLFSLSISDVFTHETLMVGDQPQYGIGPVNIQAQ